MMRSIISKNILHCVLPMILLWVPCIGVLAEEGSDSPYIMPPEVSAVSYVAGTQSTLPGIYLATKVKGTAIVTDATDIIEGYGLASGEKPYVRISDFDGKKSDLAQACIDNAAETMRAAVGPALNVEIGKMASGGFKLLPSEGAVIAMKVGIPKSFTQEGRTFAVVAVRPGGNVSILPDLDNDPDTVTFETSAGQAVYAFIKYEECP